MSLISISLATIPLSHDVSIQNQVKAVLWFLNHVADSGLGELVDILVQCSSLETKFHRLTTQRK